MWKFILEDSVLSYETFYAIIAAVNFASFQLASFEAIIST
jgi:hypothetical protein